MLEDYQEKQRNKVSGMRSVMDYVMGGIIILIGVYFLVYETLDINVFNREPSSIDKFLGIVFILYGCWRIYRGYKKDYYK